MPEETDPPITKSVDQRSKIKRSKINGVECGRRAEDRARCLMCDYYGEKNEAAFEIITRSIEKIDKKNDRRFELFEEKLRTYMTKWTMGVIVLVCSSVLGVGGAFGLWQLKSVHEELVRANDSILRLSNAVVVIATKQEGVLLRLEQIAPEHKELMRHLERNGKLVD